VGLVKRYYGWKPDLPDTRDYLYASIRPVVRVPAEVDLSPGCSAIEDQGALGSCTAQALAGNLEFLDNNIDGAYTDVSRLFIYFNERRIMGTEEYDSGASLRDGIKTLKKDGACKEVLWPYEVKKFALSPPSKCYEEAKKHRIVSYHRIRTLQEMLACLTEGYPFVFGFTVYESFETEKVARTGVVAMPKKGERALGGHAVMAAGFDKEKGRFLVRNSWGVGWGRRGYCWMPFEYLETLAGDFWTVRK
jgi:C1A family cysteine protease